MFHTFTEKLRNAPLSKKILFISLPGIFLLAAIILIGFLIIVRVDNQMIYKTSADLLAYSSRDISNSLNAASSMSDFIIADTTIQNALAETKDAGKGQTPPSAYSDIYSAVDTYYQRYREHFVNYVKVISENFSVSSYSADSSLMPPAMEDTLIEKAKEQKGGVTWITDYSDTYGIYLVRIIRRIEYMRLDDIGVLIVNIDLNKMMESISSSNNREGSTHYLLRNGSQILYAPVFMQDLTVKDLNSLPNSFYSIQKIHDEQYFIVPGRISTTGWNYYCLSSYEDMYNGLRFFQSLFIVVLFIAVCMCIVLTKRLIKPVMVHFDTLMTKIKAFGNKDFTIIQVPYFYGNRTDEIGLLHQQFDSMATEIRSLIRENYETKLAAKDSQLKALEMQINPHFLYNTLQSINWRAKMLQDQEISSMTEALGKLLRITLSSRNKDSNLGQELDLVGYYMTIQQIRYEDALTFEVNVPEDLRQVYLPKFTLQPFAENAIRYSVEAYSDDCLIRISAFATEYWIEITLANTGSSFDPDLMEKLSSGEITPHGFGIGILNVYQRLNLTFGKRFRLNFFNKDGFAVVKISVPRTTKEEYK